MKLSRSKTRFISLLLALALLGAPLFALADEGASLEQLVADPQKEITRAEFALLLNAFLGLPEFESEGFVDVDADHPYFSAVSTAQAVGYMGGYGEGIFLPDNVISGAEAASCINFFLGFDTSLVEAYPLTNTPQWAVPTVSNLIDLGMASPALLQQNSLTVADAIDLATALTVALMFSDSPYALRQTTLQDDYYAYTNRQYLATATIPPGNIFAMAFMDPQLNVDQQSTALLVEILSGDHEPGSDAWKIKEIFNMYMDEPGRAANLSKVQEIVAEVKAVGSIAELNALAAKYTSLDAIQGFYLVTANSDAKVDATKWCVKVVPGDLLLGSRDYYADFEALAPVHLALQHFIAALLNYAGETEDLDARAAAIFAMEQACAFNSLPLEVLNTPEVIYTPSSWEEMDAMTEGSGSMFYSAELREVLGEANVYCPDPDYISFVESLYTEENLETLKDFAIMRLMISFASVLGDDFLDLNQELQMALLGMVTENQSMELRAVAIAQYLMRDQLSQLYAETYCSPAIKADITEIVDLILERYEKRLTELDWMSAATKEQAIAKLQAMNAYIAYPDEYNQRYRFEVVPQSEGGDLVDIWLAYNEAGMKWALELFKEPYELNLWDGVPTYTVNAFYSPTENAFIVPAGILQEPFYSKDAPREANLGAIGGVIAHEISHAFDNNGAQFDQSGTLTNWWQEEDYLAFAALTEQVTAALSEIEFFPGGFINGLLCTGETIADLGSMACILDIASDIPDANLDLLMRSWSAIWAARMPVEVAGYLLALDTHAPNKVRTNFIISQTEEFYRTYNIAPGDGMFVPAENRIRIW